MWAGDPPGTAGGTRRVPTAGDNDVYVQFIVIEPLVLSPFTFGDPNGKQGFYGIQTMNVQVNMQSNANRAWRAVKFGNFTKTASIVGFENSHPFFNTSCVSNVV